MLVLGLFFLCGAAAADDATVGQALLAAAKAASGGERWDRLHSLHLVGSAEFAGLSGPDELWIDLDRGAYRNDSAFGAKSHIEGFDSAGGWALDDDGRPQRPRDAAAARLISERYRLLRLYWRTDAAAVVAWDGRGDDGDGSFDIVRVTPPGGRPFALLIDSRTHGIRACRLALDDGLNLTEHYSRYRRVAGLLLPFRIELTADDPGIFGDEDFSRIEVDVPLAEQATRPPH